MAAICTEKAQKSMPNWHTLFLRSILRATWNGFGWKFFCTLLLKFIFQKSLKPTCLKIIFLRCVQPRISWHDMKHKVPEDCLACHHHHLALKWCGQSVRLALAPPSCTPDSKSHHAQAPHALSLSTIWSCTSSCHWSVIACASGEEDGSWEGVQASPYFPEADCMIDQASLVGNVFLIRWLHTTVSVSVSVITCCTITSVSAPLTLTSIVSSDSEAENVRITFSILGFLNKLPRHLTGMSRMVQIGQFVLLLCRQTLHRQWSLRPSTIIF